MAEREGVDKSVICFFSSRVGYPSAMNLTVRVASVDIEILISVWKTIGSKGQSFGT